MNKDILGAYLKANYRYEDYTKLLGDYKNWLVARNLGNRITDYMTPMLDRQIFILSFRFNTEEGYNDVQRNNDLQVIVQRIKDDDGDWAVLDHYFTVTMDPKTEKLGIAHFANQVYRGNRGYHRGISTRICVRSDDGCWYFRTGTMKYLFGCIGLNKHDTGGFFNSSLGCEIYAYDSAYKTIVKPLLEGITNPTHIPCAIIDMEFTNDYFKNIISS